MSLKDTYKHLRDLLANITLDLEKSENGNKAASQRVRTGTVKMEKIAKLFRKESIATEKKTKGQKKPAKTAAKSKAGAAKGKAHAKVAHKPAAAKGGAHKAPAKTAAKSKSAVVKAKPKAKAAHASFKSRPLSVKKQTAKLPKKHSR